MSECIYPFGVLTYRQAVQEAETRLDGDQTSPAADRARLVLRIVVNVLEKNFLHFAHK